jgi:hypothetical protein
MTRKLAAQKAGDSCSAADLSAGEQTPRNNEWTGHDLLDQNQIDEEVSVEVDNDDKDSIMTDSELKSMCEGDVEAFADFN